MGILANTTVVIPFRLASKRFPQKTMCCFFGEMLIEHTLKKACSLEAAEVVVTASATDIAQVEQRVNLKQYGVNVLPSSNRCGCSTDRLVEIQSRCAGSYFLSLPIDEPSVGMTEIRRILSSPDVFGDAGAVTFYCDFFAVEDYESSLSAKMVLDQQNHLLYLSRAVIPVRKDGSVEHKSLKKNVGLFLFKRNFLQRLQTVKNLTTYLDQQEGLEQLRGLELGLRVRCHKIDHIGFGIDVPEQVEALERRVR